MKEGLKSLLRDSVIRKSIYLVVFIVILFIIILLIKYPNLPPQVPLFYSLSRGNDQLANPIFLLILPLSSILIEMINGIISISLYEKDYLTARILMILSSFVSIILFITFIKILSIIS